MGTSHVTIHRWEKGDQNAVEWLDKVENLARALGCHPGELFEDLPSGPALSAEEQRLIEAFRGAGSELREAMMSMASTVPERRPFPKKRRSHATG